MGRAVATCLLLVFFPGASASGQADMRAEVHLLPPRDYGYFIGDLLELHASVQVPRDFVLDGRSLAEADRPDWLEVGEVTGKLERAAGARLYRFRFVYQLFYVPDSLTRLAVPARSLIFQSEQMDEQIQASIPAFHFSISPVTDTNSGIEPDWPVPAPSVRWIVLSAGSLVAFLVLGAGSLVAQRRTRRRRVFWQADQKVRGTRDCAEALLLVHRALEERAGTALFADDLDVLTQRWPPAGTMLADLERFFVLSEGQFYGGDGAEASADCLRWVQQLSQQLMTLERRYGDGQRVQRSYS